MFTLKFSHNMEIVWASVHETIEDAKAALQKQHEWVTAGGSTFSTDQEFYFAATLNTRARHFYTASVEAI